MPSVPKKIYERLVAGIKQFQPVLASAKSCDVNEADTVAIINTLKIADRFPFHSLSNEIGCMLPISLLISKRKSCALR